MRSAGIHRISIPFRPAPTPLRASFACGRRPHSTHREDVRIPGYPTQNRNQKTEPEQSPAGQAAAGAPGRKDDLHNTGAQAHRQNAGRTRIWDMQPRKDAPSQARTTGFHRRRTQRHALRAFCRRGPRPGADQVSAFHPECGECALFKAGSRYIVARCGTPGSGPNAAPPDDPLHRFALPLARYSPGAASRGWVSTVPRSNTMSDRQTGSVKWFPTTPRGFGFITRKMAAPTCSCTSVPSRAAASVAGGSEGVVPRSRRPEGPAGRGSPGRVIPGDIAARAWQNPLATWGFV